MNKLLVLAAVIGACACRQSPAAMPQQQPDLAVATAALRGNLLAARATFDGAPVTDLKQTGRCRAVIVTSRGSTGVDWKGLGNFAPRLQGGQTLVTLLVGGRQHLLSIRSNHPKEQGIEMGLGLLDEECARAGTAG